MIDLQGKSKKVASKTQTLKQTTYLAIVKVRSFYPSQYFLFPSFPHTHITQTSNDQRKSQIQIKTDNIYEEKAHFSYKILSILYFHIFFLQRNLLGLSSPSLFTVALFLPNTLKSKLLPICLPLVFVYFEFCCVLTECWMIERIFFHLCDENMQRKQWQPFRHCFHLATEYIRLVKMEKVAFLPQQKLAYTHSIYTGRLSDLCSM